MVSEHYHEYGRTLYILTKTGLPTLRARLQVSQHGKNQNLRL